MYSSLEVRLPFRLSLPQGQQFLTIRNSVSYKVSFRHIDLMIVGEEWREPLLVTVATVMIGNGEEQDLNKEPSREEIQGFFQTSFDYLNHFIDVYRTNERDYSIRNITLLDFPSVTEIEVNHGSYYYIVDIPTYVDFEKLDNEHQLEVAQRVGAAMATRDQWPQFYNARRFYTGARQYLEQGNHFNAVIELETSFEIQVRTTFFMILSQEEKISEAKRANLITTSLRNVIESHFTKYLGGNFSYKDPGPIKTWHDNLYMLRNECVHEGKFFVSGKEVNIAFDAYHEAENYIGQKLIEKGYISQNARVQLERYMPRRRIEDDPETVIQRLKATGFLESHIGIAKSKEDLAREAEDDNSAQ
jgi:hypothetical protein